MFEQVLQTIYRRVGVIPSLGTLILGRVESGVEFLISRQTSKCKDKSLDFRLAYSPFHHLAHLLLRLIRHSQTQPHQ